jgi:predicted dehydrogenase
LIVLRNFSKALRGIKPSTPASRGIDGPGINSLPLRVAISGYGWIAKNRHEPCFQRLGCEVVAVYRSAYRNLSPSLKRVERFEDLFEFSPDIVAICSPPWAHAEQAIKAMERGCHVLVEKPMAMNADEARSMVDTSRQTGQLLTVAHSHLFDRSVIQAIEMLREGIIGELTSVQALFFRGDMPETKPWLFQLPGGLTFDELPHPVYLMQKFLGPSELKSLDVETVSGRNTPRQIHAVLKGEKITGNISMIMDSPVSEWHFILVGTKKMLIIDLFRDILVKIPSDGTHQPLNVIKTSGHAFASHIFGVLNSGFKYASGRLFYGHDVLIEDFVSSIRTGSSLPVSPEQALRTQELVDQIIQPVISGNPI